MCVHRCICVRIGVCVCVCAYLCVCVHLCTQVHTHIWCLPQLLLPLVLFLFCFVLFCETRPRYKGKLTHSVRMAGQITPVATLYILMGLQEHTAGPSFLHACQGCELWSSWLRCESFNHHDNDDDDVI
jgi:hypothetical protein